MEQLELFESPKIIQKIKKERKLSDFVKNSNIIFIYDSLKKELFYRKIRDYDKDKLDAFESIEFANASISSSGEVEFSDPVSEISTMIEMKSVLKNKNRFVITGNIDTIKKKKVLSYSKRIL